MKPIETKLKFPRIPSPLTPPSPSLSPANTQPSYEQGIEGLKREKTREKSSSSKAITIIQIPEERLKKAFIKSYLGAFQYMAKDSFEDIHSSAKDFAEQLDKIAQKDWKAVFAKGYTTMILPKREMKYVENYFLKKEKETEQEQSQSQSQSQNNTPNGGINTQNKNPSFILKKKQNKEAQPLRTRPHHPERLLIDILDPEGKSLGLISEQYLDF